ncbi:hypothetical protein TNCV_1871851 [Trichonephila clavipes]|nr:hypothetical protein TNCV_1871851 [Trichonephila clavipes]
MLPEATLVPGVRWCPYVSWPVAQEIISLSNVPHQVLEADSPSCDPEPDFLAPILQTLFHGEKRLTQK